jgi:hypothetical protein
MTTEPAPAPTDEELFGRLEAVTLIGEEGQEVTPEEHAERRWSLFRKVQVEVADMPGWAEPVAIVAEVLRLLDGLERVAGRADG